MKTVMTLLMLTMVTMTTQAQQLKQISYQDGEQKLNGMVTANRAKKRPCCLNSSGMEGN